MSRRANQWRRPLGGGEEERRVGGHPGTQDHQWRRIAGKCGASLRTQGSSHMRLRKDLAASAWRGWRASLMTPLEETVVKSLLEGR